MNKRILNEAKRAFGCLEQMDPQDADVYNKLAETIDNLISLSFKLQEDWTEYPWWEMTGAKSKGEVPEMVLREQAPTQPEADVPYEEPESPFPEPEPEPEHEPEPDNVVPIKQYDRATVREALGKLRVKGIDINPLFQKYGADRFNALPEARYAELMADVEELNAR